MKKTLMPFILMLSSCASITPQELRSDNPAILIESDRETKDIAVCIADEWEKTKIVSITGNESPVINYRPTKNGHSVTMYMLNNITHIADINRKGSKSVISVYTRQLSLGIDPSLSRAAGCQ